MLHAFLFNNCLSKLIGRNISQILVQKFFRRTGHSVPVSKPRTGITFKENSALFLRGLCCVPVTDLFDVTTNSNFCAGIGAGEGFCLCLHSTCSQSRNKQNCLRKGLHQMKFQGILKHSCIVAGIVIIGVLLVFVSRKNPTVPQGTAAKTEASGNYAPPPTLAPVPGADLKGIPVTTIDLSAGAVPQRQAPMNDPELDAGFNAFRSNLFSEAVPHLLAASSRNPMDVRPFIWLGLSYEQLSRCDQAQPNFERALKLNSAQPNVWYYLARVRSQCGMYNESVAALNEAIKLDANIRGSALNDPLFPRNPMVPLP